MAAATTKSNESILFGSQDIPLLETTLGKLIDEQAERHGNKAAVVFAWQQRRLSYQQLADRSRMLAKSMLEMGLKHGQCIGIMAGNCYQYIEVFLGGARIGCPVVVLNNTYTSQEMTNAIARSNCALLFLAPEIGPKDQSAHVRLVCNPAESKSALPELRRLVLLSESVALPSSNGPEVISYNAFVLNSHSVFMTNAVLKRAERMVKPNDVLNLQFTSGTTGAPKAAMLTHRNLINNGHLVGQRMHFGPGEIICCPPPLFHCFGLAMGFLGSFTNGSTIIFPSDQHNATETLEVLVRENCSSLYGVPTMFVATLEANKSRKHKLPFLRKGLAAGSPVPRALMKVLERDMGIKTTLIAYGMTETSPVTSMTAIDDSLDQRMKTVGRVLPHTGLKIVDEQGNVVPRGVRGEICTSGYALQKGYWKNENKTKEVMRRDSNKILWMHTGDEGLLDGDGFCWITGRIKDLIIRGGENIFPLEIEERLLAHASVAEASVVGLPDERYGEVVGCFLRQQKDTSRPIQEEVADWVRGALGKQKAPQHIFWIGDAGVGDDFPKTGSGKHQKHILRDIGKGLLKQGKTRAKL